MIQYSHVYIYIYSKGIYIYIYINICIYLYNSIHIFEDLYGKISEQDIFPSHLLHTCPFAKY